MMSKNKYIKAKSSKRDTLTRRDFISKSLKTGTAAFTTGLLPRLSISTNNRYNVLFIIVDDLRPLLGCYGHAEMHTPNIDRLAARGTVFNRAYCQFPVCNPSRASLLTGLRPETIGIHDNYTHFRETMPDVVALPQYFKLNGYHTRSIGKIMHGPFDDEVSWSEPSWEVKGGKYKDIPSWQSLDVSDDELEDGKIAQHTVGVLEEVQDTLFFLAVGFNKPHMPFDAPEKYYELYDSYIIDNVPKVIPPTYHELRAYSDLQVVGVPLTEEKTIELIRGYMASTSYMDAQVGVVLDQLDRLSLTEKTIILFCGDHGFHLGEHETWGKRTLFEVALRSPLIMSIPHPTHSGSYTNALVELVDIYPTLCDSCDLQIPTQLEGLSMLPVIHDPTAAWKTAAFSKVGRDYGKRSIRTHQYRYNEQLKNSAIGKELYDYYSDPYETENLAYLPDKVDLVAELSKRLHGGWKAALPGNNTSLLHQQTSLRWDVNNDGIVDVQDLLMISNNFNTHTPENEKVDVNMDGEVNIIDLLLVAAHLGESSNGQSPKQISISSQSIKHIENWVFEAQIRNDSSSIFQKGITNLEMLMNSVLPKISKLLPNFPNPFNPETWIPYDLSIDADVSIHIYNIKGESVRHLKLGFQTGGTYRTLSRAAYWDGRNSLGEYVASGTYFYTMQAGKYQSTRKMVVTK